MAEGTEISELKPATCLGTKLGTAPQEGQFSPFGLGGFVDPSQRVKIVGELKDGGLDAQAAEFLDSEIQHPATIDARHRRPPSPYILRLTRQLMHWGMIRRAQIGWAPFGCPDASGERHDANVNDLC